MEWRNNDNLEPIKPIIRLKYFIKMSRIIPIFGSNEDVQLAAEGLAWF